MLSATWAPGVQLHFPVLVSPKLDGVRALGIDGWLVSRRLKPIPNGHVQRLFGNLPEGLDGELIVGSPTAPDCYRRTMSGVMSQDGEPPVRFFVFDNWCTGTRMGFEKRLDSLTSMVRGAASVVVLQHVFLWSMDELLVYEEECLAEGFEGVMIRDPEGPYKQGRSTVREGWLLKMKRFVDSEATVVGCYEQMHNANPATKNALGYTEHSSHQENLVGKGVLGGFHARDCVSGVEFDCGGGFTDYDRRSLWEQRETLPGQVFKYKSLPVGVKEKPRHPVWLGMRPSWDMPAESFHWEPLED